jgi:hypothetical protein
MVQYTVKPVSIVSEGTTKINDECGKMIVAGQEAGWASELVRTQRIEEKSFACPGVQTLVIQPVVRHYTD